jgi:nitrate reductase assembly molybdenum cofactor insertion protein NarJ
MTAVIGRAETPRYRGSMPARDDVQRIAAVLARPHAGYLTRVKAHATAIAPRSGEAARQLGLFADRVGELSTAELQELYDETFARGGVDAAPLALRMARHRTSPEEARVALDTCARLLDHLQADRNPFEFVVRALCCVLLIRANDTHVTYESP